MTAWQLFIEFLIIKIVCAQGPGAASLVFESIGISDGGRYICTASNRFGRTEETVDINGMFGLITMG